MLPVGSCKSEGKAKSDSEKILILHPMSIFLHICLSDVKCQFLATVILNKCIFYLNVLKVTQVSQIIYILNLGFVLVKYKAHIQKQLKMVFEYVLNQNAICRVTSQLLFNASDYYLRGIGTEGR